MDVAPPWGMLLFCNIGHPGHLSETMMECASGRFTERSIVTIAPISQRRIPDRVEGDRSCLRVRRNDVRHHDEEVAGASGDDKDVPQSVEVADATVQGQENCSDCVTQSSGSEQSGSIEGQ